MLKDHIASQIRKHLKETATPSQELLIEALASFTLDEVDDALLIVKGYAGTGKTTAISAFVEVLDEIKRKSVLLAPTGRAAKVLSSYSGKTAYTIHKKIYRQRGSKDGFGRFVLDNNLHTNTFFIIDEASMISDSSQEGSVFGSGSLLQDLLEYVYNGKGCKLLLVGDTAQLPPVGLDISPALSKEKMKIFSDSIFMEELKEVVRQKRESGILFNATKIRERLDVKDYSLPLFSLDGFEDVIRVSGVDLLETISTNYDKFGIEETIIVSRSNKRANRYNQGVRNSILGRDEELVPGDLLMVVKNNYFWLREGEEIDFIANGDIVEIVKIRKYHELYGYRFADCTVRLIDYDTTVDVKILLDVLYEETPALSSQKNKELYYTILEDYADIKPKKKQYEQVKNNEYFNALQVKYAYAVTCHKSQGGQWKSVFVDQGYIQKEQIDREYLRWLYTALTRASEKVYLVNFPDYFFEG
jgi:exodeoxyribonuclease-5